LFTDLLGFDFVGALTGESQEKNSNVKGKGEEEEEEGSSTCDCEGNGCNCCVDFNLTSIIDLGGPGWYFNPQYIVGTARHLML